MLNSGYKDDTIYQARVHSWFICIKNVKMSIDDQTRTIKEIEELSEVIWSSIRRILLEDL